MRLKIADPIGKFAWSLAILAASLSSGSVASVQRAVTIDMEVSRLPAARAVSYGAPVYYASPRAVREGASLPGASSGSVAPEVDGWTLLAAILGLISMRLWRGETRKLPVIK